MRIILNEMKASRNVRIALTTVACLLLFVAVRTVVAFVRYSRIEREFPTIRVGQSRGAVVTSMGKPNYYAGKCGVIHVPDKNCATEYVYSYPFAPIIPEYYIVSFSSDDRVIEADEWDSP